MSLTRKVSMVTFIGLQVRDKWIEFALGGVRNQIRVESNWKTGAVALSGWRWWLLLVWLNISCDACQAQDKSGNGKSKAAVFYESFSVGNKMSENISNSHVRNRIIIAFFCYLCSVFIFYSSSQTNINLFPTSSKCWRWRFHVLNWSGGMK